jgi:hypothetical protein
LKNALLTYAVSPGSSDRFNPAAPSAIGDLRDAGSENALRGDIYFDA